MALSVNLPTSPIGAPVPGAYARIAAFFGDKTTVNLDVSFHFSQAAREAGAREVDFRRYSFPRPVADILAGGYELLKGHADFAGATDC